MELLYMLLEVDEKIGKAQRNYYIDHNRRGE